ncbi:hypothetical protein ACFSKU_10305 [Pontibacter silvestris]|uniref:His-Xaa-Ser system protein HxsD n=1 Tax=Pontibacter silvestris TaxID=2305183 RepID=A0ABW4WXX1_9BACT|nr:hypothetical protein [Pontibacter silvestris]MCC9136772.1 hypothetical protein [Pontibacter silvestris]
MKSTPSTAFKTNTLDDINSSNIRYSISLSFEEIRLPPFQDILILSKNCAQGRIGLNKSFELMAPNGFASFEVDDDKVEAVFINKKILSKISAEKLLRILKSKVFDYVSEGELLKVDLKVSMSYTNIEYEI